MCFWATRVPGKHPHGLSNQNSSMHAHVRTRRACVSATSSFLASVVSWQQPGRAPCRGACPAAACRIAPTTRLGVCCCGQRDMHTLVSRARSMSASLHVRVPCSVCSGAFQRPRMRGAAGLQRLRARTCIDAHSLLPGRLRQAPVTCISLSLSAHCVQRFWLCRQLPLRCCARLLSTYSYPCMGWVRHCAAPACVTLLFMNNVHAAVRGCRSLASAVLNKGAAAPCNHEQSCGTTHARPGLECLRRCRQHCSQGGTCTPAATATRWCCDAGRDSTWPLELA